MTMNGIDTQSEPEGMDEQNDLSWDEYPIDTLLIRNERRSVFEVVRRIKRGEYIMDPDFQRDFIWPIDKQSKLIESVLMRIPLPVFYLAEDEHGKIVVVDGLQRLTTFQRFVDGEFRLRLPKHKELDNRQFEDLGPKLQNRIEDCNLILYVIDSKAPERTRLDIFERVNGGVPLTRQQMRNCLFMGEGTRFLKSEANTDIFLTATGRSLRTHTMRDREFVNRFCAFQIFTYKEYKGDMDDFLASALSKMNQMRPEELEELSTEFQTSLNHNFHVFGRHAFRKHYDSLAGRSVLNASLWDVMSTGLSHYSEKLVASRAELIQDAFFDLMEDREFMTSITYGTNDVRRVKYRFEAVNAVLGMVME